MDKIGVEKNTLHKSLSDSEEIDFLGLIAAQVNFKWKRNDFISEYQQQRKRQKKDDDDFTRQDNGKGSKDESQAQVIQRKGGDSCCHNTTQTMQYLQSELEKVRRKCEELESENTQLTGQLMENDNKLQGEKDKFQREIKGLNKLVEKLEKQRELDKDLRINFQNELKGKQEEIENLRRHLDEMSGLVNLKAEEERGALENENFRLKNEISEMEGLFEEIQDQFENKLKEKSSEIV